MNQQNFQVEFHQSPKQVVTPGARQNSRNGREPGAAANHASISRTAQAAPSQPAQRSPDAIAQLLSDLIGQIGESETRRRESLAELQQLAIEIAMLATGKLLFQEIGRDQFPFQQVIEQMISHLPIDQPICVHLHSHDLKLLQDQISQLQPEWNQAAKITLQADPHLPRGSCLVESQQYTLFYDIGLQLNEMRQILLENMDVPPNERRTTRSAHSNLRRFPDRRTAS